MKTITAISTPAGVGGIGIVRISGDKSLEIINKIFKQKSKKDINANTIVYGQIIDDNNMLDEVLVSYFKAPKTYTGEDICEINCHGGNIVMKKILDLVIRKGAVLAEPGEFTKRAFLNGKLDLSQAEAVIDIINSKSEKENKASLNQLKGQLGSKIREIKSDIVGLLVDIEASIDYPEYDIEEVKNERINKVLNETIIKLQTLEDSFKDGKLIKDGIRTVIVGKPNVGKSSILNALLKEERAIVTEIAGTTRDTIEEFLTIKGIPLKIIDTAGIRETEDIIEEIGVNKSRKAIEDADLILMILDATIDISEEDKKLLEEIKGKPHIVIINKIDIGNKIKSQDISSDNIVEISAKTLEGLEELEEKIESMFNLNQISIDNEVIITNTRHKNLITTTKDMLQKAKESLKSGIPIDILAIDMKEAIQNLGEITGESVSEEVIKRHLCKILRR
jgi:tRNA modification GTPase